MPKDPEQICTSSDGSNKTAIAGFAMPESEHPSLSGIDLSQLSEEELIDAIASAHEKELALESNDKGDAESPSENETEAEEDIDPFPREEVVTLESWCTAPHGSGCTRCQAVCPTGALSLENGTPRINTELCTRCGMCAGICDAFAFTRITLEDLSPARNAKQKKKAPCASPATTTCLMGLLHAATLLHFPA